MAARPITADVQRILNRLEGMWKAWKPESPEFKRAFYLIGERLKTTAKLKARSLSIGNTGRTINSISYMPAEQGIIFGVFGASYAKYHEYGSEWTEKNRRAMFYYMRKTGQKPQRSKGVVKNGRITPRPFVNPAVQNNREYIIDQIRLIGASKK